MSRGGGKKFNLKKIFYMVTAVIVLGSVAEIAFSSIVNANSNSTISSNKTVGPLVTLFQVLIGLGFAIGGGFSVLEYGVE